MKRAPFTSASIFILTILSTIGLSLPGYCQSANHETDRIVWLTNGDTLYSHQLKIKGQGTPDTYLLLDNDRQVPIHLVSRFRGRDGSYIPLPGSAGTDFYKVVKEGRRISEYSRTFYEAPLDSNGRRPVAYYFRKTGEQQMQLLTYQNMLNAMADTPPAQQQLQAMKTETISGLGIILAGAAVTIAGFLESHRNTSQPPAAPTLPANPIWPQSPFGPPPPPPQLPPLPPLPKPSLSPLVFIGAGGMAIGFAVTLGSKHHMTRALDLYNQ